MAQLEYYGIKNATAHPSLLVEDNNLSAVDMHPQITMSTTPCRSLSIAYNVIFLFSLTNTVGDFQNPDA